MGSRMVSLALVTMLALQTFCMVVPTAMAEEPPPLSLSFSGQKAYAHIQTQMAFGYRIPDTKEHKDCVDYMTNTLNALGLEVNHQKFVGADGDGQGINFTNVIGLLKANETTEADVILAAHFDTRPFTDHDITGAPIEPDFDNPVPGANDGASGVAVLLELARVMRQYNRTHNIIFFFTDGEDYGRDIGSMLYGAKHYAARMTKEDIENIRYLILVDMIGDKELTIHREANSDYLLMNKIWSKAESLGYDQFENTSKYNIWDDHIPFKDRGVTVVDLIDFDFPNEDMNYWHTPEDTLDKVSSVSLEAVGRTVEGVLVDDIVYHPSSNDTNNNTTNGPPPPPKPKPKDPGFIPLLGGPVILAAVTVSLLIGNGLRKRHLG